MRYEMLKFIRGKKFYIILAIMGIIAAAFVIVPPALGESYPDANGTIEFFSQFASILIILIATLFGADSIVYDFEKGTAFVLYTNPVRRRTIFAGKFVSAILVSSVTIAIYYAIATIIDLAINGGAPVATIYSLLMALAYMAALMSVTFLVSTTMKSTLAASVIVFALFFLILSMVESILTFAGQKPFFVLTSMDTVITDILISPFPQTISQEIGAFKVLIYHPSVATALIVMAVYGFCSLGLAYNRFIKKELQ
jgi:ABC-type transport system involved in multi-copper enzyme maturation permease subunit